jgi:hypothetical protein
MASHLLVDQLRFSRSEFLRCIEGITPEEAKRRLGQMNSISWIIGHLAHQERVYWVLSQGRDVAPDVAKCGWGQPACTPELADVLRDWRAVTEAADEFLESLAPTDLMQHTEQGGQPSRESVGTRLLRNIMHYWFHLGEAHAIRQSLGHRDLPQFVGTMTDCTYRPE